MTMVSTWDLVARDWVAERRREDAALNVQDEKRQKKAEHSQKQAEASAPAPMDPVLATVATPTMATSKERKRALQKERAAERERALVEKQRAGRWQAIRRSVSLPPVTSLLWCCSLWLMQAR